MYTLESDDRFVLVLNSCISFCFVKGVLSVKDEDSISKKGDKYAINRPSIIEIKQTIEKVFVSDWEHFSSRFRVNWDLCEDKTTTISDGFFYSKLIQEKSIKADWERNMYQFCKVFVRKLTVSFCNEISFD